jgi:hypothetical protein
MNPAKQMKFGIARIFSWPLLEMADSRSLVTDELCIDPLQHRLLPTLKTCTSTWLLCVLHDTWINQESNISSLALKSSKILHHLEIKAEPITMVGQG